MMPLLVFWIRNGLPAMRLLHVTRTRNMLYLLLDLTGHHRHAKILKGDIINAYNYPIKQNACTRLAGERVFSTRRSRDFQRGFDPGQRAKQRGQNIEGGFLASTHKACFRKKNIWPCWRASREARAVIR